MQIDFARYWYSKSTSVLVLLLLPFSWLFRLCVFIRHKLYRSGLLKTQRFAKPVIVVGNLTVGGTGKTPFVIWLAKLLQAQGYRPGIVSRGVGGKVHAKPHIVTANDTAVAVGDEALLLRNSGSPVVLCVDRAAAVTTLLQQFSCDIVISDDGLQHYRLGRDIEIAIVDGERRFGNQCMLPAGPLREPLTRIKNVDFVVVNGGERAEENVMQLQPVQLVSVKDSARTASLAAFANENIHAVAGIGNPGRFFSLLRNNGFDITPHAFSDHYLYRPVDVEFGDSRPVVMTEKDAVKCTDFVDDRYWYLQVSAKLGSNFERQLLSRLKSLEVCNEYENDFAKNCKSYSGAQSDNLQYNDNCSADRKDA